MLALGLLTRPAACPIVIFLLVSNYERHFSLAALVAIGCEAVTLGDI
jgi:uncharacterized membrane protein YphA (DoxX/SURF4 family)